ncbi:hypothetical protein [Paenimyroides aestuarii]|uniref:Uncharacterized protein n=1 Tax=Paenimyroides aestuarii TaxID=2968490 RepID=A0ABY5NPQ3_9FLAO|nr:hypothetical protein [Paenimyroides aestuarii]UUV20477.1 hypothetical protein NPX36_08870 [Paenimyroides aestuarii]
MKKIIVLLFLFPSILFANMAKPWVDGSMHSVLFGAANATVKNEIIDIRLVRDSIEETYFANFSIKYRILSEQKQKLPLLFIAIDLYDKKYIKVNNQSTVILPLDFEKNTYPFFKKNEKGTFIMYDKYNEVPVNQNDVIYFSADLEKGENVIEVRYDASLQYNTYGFVTTYELLYSLSPSKFWKSFGDIEVNLILDENLEFIKSNLGAEKTENKILHWNISPKNHENIAISITEKTSFLSKILLFLQPLGISILALIGMLFLHFKWMKFNPTRNTLFFGLIIFPILFFVVYFLSFHLIDFSLSKTNTKHGYTFFIVIIYPIVLLLYGLFAWGCYKIIRK